MKGKKIPLPKQKKPGRGKYPARKNHAFLKRHVYVQALASQGDEIALNYALDSAQSVHLLIVSPLLRGSNPYPCGSLTYRCFNLLKV